MKEIKDSFSKIEFETAKEALLQVFSYLLNEGKSKNYGIYYIWSKNNKFYTEVSGKYHSVDLRDNETVYVDLGLSSGTLWANDYEKENGRIVYYTHLEASKFCIPSREQWNELKDSCCWKYVTKYGLSEDSELEEVICIGPNGNAIRFNVTGFFELGQINNGSIYCWLKDGNELNEKNCVCIERAFASLENRKKHYCNTNQITSLFTGFKLPIRLVCSK